MTKVIALDAGHGLMTAGKQTLKGDKGIIKEWTLNDAVRDKVVLLLKDYDCEFIFLDNDEGKTDESLKDRFNKYIGKADVIVSIHHNAYRSVWGNHTGVEVWTDRNYTAKDEQLAKAIYKNLPKYTELRGRGIKRENWAVINQNSIPGVLVEGGFMDSLIDYPVITSEAGQLGYAKAVAEGLIDFLKLEKKKVEKPAEQPKPVTTTKFNVGDKVKIKATAEKYENSTKAIPSWVKKNTYTVSKVDNKKVLLKEITSWVKATDLELVKAATVKTTTTSTTIKVGDKVKVKSTATKYATGQTIPSWVKGKTYTVSKIDTKNKRYLLKEITSWVKTSDVGRA